MRLVLHPKVYLDIDEIMGYYERVATPGLAEEVAIWMPGSGLIICCRNPASLEARHVLRQLDEDGKPHRCPHEGAVSLWYRSLRPCCAATRWIRILSSCS